MVQDVHCEMYTDGRFHGRNLMLYRHETEAGWSAPWLDPGPLKGGGGVRVGRQEESVVPGRAIEYSEEQLFDRTESSDQPGNGAGSSPNRKAAVPPETPEAIASFGQFWVNPLNINMPGQGPRVASGDSNLGPFASDSLQKESMQKDMSPLAKARTTGPSSRISQSSGGGVAGPEQGPARPPPEHSPLYSPKTQPVLLTGGGKRSPLAASPDRGTSPVERAKAAGSPDSADRATPLKGPSPVPARGSALARDSLMGGMANSGKLKPLPPGAGSLGRGGSMTTKNAT
eukprot:CAMPEP_0114115856 /NCGR_PEP_ID=MMETSP0043_2-20121206/4189_1 /TAXON_ID=464988 /ORGANISM="Hemiselmis andersenii, Strain CCMP644" /LENGTH=285 /DNA_ID=CAMNT_0001208141 /DNA_START=77 /DNA_END=935 /DNA_ORIENTATION=-